MELANKLPRGCILICLPRSQGKMQDMLQKVIEQLKTKGQQVTVLSSGQFR